MYLSKRYKFTRVKIGTVFSVDQNFIYFIQMCLYLLQWMCVCVDMYVFGMF